MGAGRWPMYVTKTCRSRIDGYARSHAALPAASVYIWLQTEFPFLLDDVCLNKYMQIY